MGNGAKAARRREKLAKDKKPVKKSQLKANEAAKTVICSICRTPFMRTIRRVALQGHAENKHDKTVEDCFPGWTD
ncbi:hypothetical protein SJAG_04365 [Schizosaccharomyces japonicus yFS275]|uniref:DUF1909-domain-containing protein n=1 Tax=Schizosaccharomyces japonicus (strain yFS275 / FY16936) TaxID=402676 RepID=B6K6M8_SCHJY|nr:hypothetical protein SJAG_04365 [Schizosaccharomyces japonicus yFS275]EEB09182.1 hypothetical protein SJAG_04365 [Schizosaccharomyces japonicus yFS275]